MLFKILRTHNDFSCTADGGPAFFVGRRVPYEGHIGLYNIFGGSPLQKLNYAATDFRAEFAFWADFIEPTALCEGRNFLTLNTYDRACFTFGFAQFAAHVADGDFVQYFRRLLALPSAQAYFPELDLVDGRISKTDVPKPYALEDSVTTAKLMAFLNPSLDEVEDAEVIAAARFIHWTAHEPAAQAIQVSVMIDAFKTFVARADKRVGLQGRSAAICCVIADILHQGRGGKMTWQLVEDALHSAHPLDSLLDIGAHKYAERCKTLGKAISQRPEFSQRHWDKASASFV